MKPTFFYKRKIIQILFLPTYPIFSDWYRKQTFLGLMGYKGVQGFHPNPLSISKASFAIGLKYLSSIEEARFNAKKKSQSEHFILYHLS